MKNGELYYQFAILHSSCKDTYSITTFLILVSFVHTKKGMPFRGTPLGWLAT